MGPSEAVHAPTLAIVTFGCTRARSGESGLAGSPRWCERALANSISICVASDRGCCAREGIYHFTLDREPVGAPGSREPETGGNLIGRVHLQSGLIRAAQSYLAWAGLFPLSVSHPWTSSATPTVLANTQRGRRIAEERVLLMLLPREEGILVEAHRPLLTHWRAVAGRQRLHPKPIRQLRKVRHHVSHSADA